MSSSAAQQSIGWLPVPSDPNPRALSFLEFHRSNPQVFRRFLELARERVQLQKALGRRPRLGAKAIWERLRWDMEFAGPSSKPFRLNNNHTALYARLLVETYHEEFSGVFELRELRTA